jgi:uncharacterized membrane protein
VSHTSNSMVVYVNLSNKVDYTVGYLYAVQLLCYYFSYITRTQLHTQVVRRRKMHANNYSVDKKFSRRPFQVTQSCLTSLCAINLSCSTNSKQYLQ